MEGRIGQRCRGLQRGPFVLYSGPFSSCLGLYALHERFQSSEDSIYVPESSLVHGQVKPRARGAGSESPGDG